MRDLLSSAFLGFVQGITEFLPISSTGHLVITREVLGINISNGLAFDAILQLATTLAVIIYFRKDLLSILKNFCLWVFGGKKGQQSVSKEQKIQIKAIIIGTIPAVILGLLLEDLMNSIFRNPLLVAASLLVGSLIMYLADRFYKGQSTLSTKRGFWIGIFQSLALVPGFSRSGMTISGGFLLGLNRVEATRFSFLLATPILLGSGLKKFWEISSAGLLSSIGLDLLIGSIVAFVVGLWAISFLIRFLQNNNLKNFITYRIILAIVIVIFLS